jgi:type I restriction enzyme R subunit
MTNSKEAKARIKINKLLEEAGWRFENSKDGKANIRLEASVKFLDGGDDFENSQTHDGRRGAIDFLLLDKDQKPLVVVEAKKESIDPLSAKDQAKNYARSCGARFIILSNGNIHYLWDTKHGNPETISRFPTQESITQFEKYLPNPLELAEATIDENYIIASQMPNFALDPSFKNDLTRSEFLAKNNLKQLRFYQIQAIRAIQESAKKGSQRFLFEMATGTGKTLTSAAVIKLFLKTGNAQRVLFLVDRLELEEQARKDFERYLGKDYTVKVYKKHRDSWASAAVVISTVQTFLAGDRYKKEFSPTDFELVISDEAHRSIGGNSRAVFEYFVGYKLGLTATPKNYLHGFDSNLSDTQREYERRLLIDTYKTFGCEAGIPTFSYDLEKGADDGYLIKPTLVDARTEITTQLLSDEGYSVLRRSEDGEEAEEKFNERHFEKKIFNESTNVAMCQALIENGLYDPIAAQLGIKLFGKTIVFCVSQSHAARIANILNKIAAEKWPETYGDSTFAAQVSSQVFDAGQMTINFANNYLNGRVSKPQGYESSKTRIAVTVGMMTTGYDCPDLLNLALMRPVFSPSDFVQIKGRGTRKNKFEFEYSREQKLEAAKEKFKFFDFFATAEYFEEEFDYDEKIKLPNVKDLEKEDQDFSEEKQKSSDKSPIDLATKDQIQTYEETPEGIIMRIDREGFKKAVQEDISDNDNLRNLWQNGDEEEAEDFVKKHVFDKPKHFLNLDKIRQIFNVDRRISVKEFLQFAFGDKERFESKDELLDLEWQKFVDIHHVDQDHYQATKNFFKAYIVDEEVRNIIKTNKLGFLNNCASFDFAEYQKLNGFKTTVPQYINDYTYHLTNL